MIGVALIAAVGIAIGVAVPLIPPVTPARVVPKTTPQVAQVVTTPAPTPLPTPKYSNGVLASWYGVQEYCAKYNPSCIMANRKKLVDEDFTAACAKKWPLGTKLHLRHNGKDVIVECTDRGSFEEKYGRQLDLSKAAFTSLAPLSRGVIEVEVQ